MDAMRCVNITYIVSAVLMLCLLSSSVSGATFLNRKDLLSSLQEKRPASRRDHGRQALLMPFRDNAFLAKLFQGKDDIFNHLNRKQLNSDQTFQKRQRRCYWSPVTCY